MGRFNTFLTAGEFDRFSEQLAGLDQHYLEADVGSIFSIISRLNRRRLTETHIAS